MKRGTIHWGVGAVVLAVSASVFGPAAGASAGDAPSADKPLRVLFIGNSMTFFSSMPSIVQQLSEADPAGPRIEVDYAGTAVIGSNKIWANNNGRVRDKLNGGRWDFVVIQDWGLTPGGGFEGFEPIVAAAKQVGAARHLHHT